MKTYLFPGQGSQIKGMGGALFDNFPELTEIADSILGYSIKALCLQDESKVLNQTQYTQPALYVVNALSYQEKINRDSEKPDYLAGHSLGEYNALQAAGAISFEDGLRLVKKRGELMSRAAEGAMAAVLNLTEKDIKHCLRNNGFTGIDIANYNSPEQTVISGLRDDMNNVQACLEEAGAAFIPLNTSGAFHSRYMDPAKTEFEAFLQTYAFTEPQIPVISNIHAEPYQQDQIAQNLANQITHSVKWLQGMQYLLKQGDMEFEELGVGDVLTKLLKNIQVHFAATGHDEKNRGNEHKAQIEVPVDTDLMPVRTIDAETKTEWENEIEAKHGSVDDWNHTYPKGAKVTVKGYPEELETRTEAMVLFGHRAAIYLKGYNGYFALDEVTPVAEHT